MCGSAALPFRTHTHTRNGVSECVLADSACAKSFLTPLGLHIGNVAAHRTHVLCVCLLNDDVVVPLLAGRDTYMLYRNAVSQKVNVW